MGRKPASSIEHFYTTVAGVGHDNAKGGSRQKIVKKLKVGEPLQFEAEPSNPYDRNAIRVVRANGEQVGYLPKQIAAATSRYISDGRRYAAIVKNLTGGGAGKETRGANLLVVSAAAGVSDSDVQRYLARVKNEPDRDPGEYNVPVKAKKGCGGCGCFAVVVIVVLVVLVASVVYHK